MNLDQLHAIVWLRWRLSRNRFARGGTFNAVLSILMLAMLVSGAAAAGIGGFLTGVFALAKSGPMVLLLVWDGVLFGFLMLWFAGLMAEIQRSESVDLTRLLHLPLTLEQVFVFNYLASHLSPALVLFLPGMLGLAAGLCLGIGPRMAPLIPLVLGFVFMLSAWTYCLRGWLAALMVNKRRRRAIVVWLTIGFVLLFQIPNLVINSQLLHKKRSAREQPRPGSSSAESRSNQPHRSLPENVIWAHLGIPPCWIGYGAMTLEQHNPWPALEAASASCLLAVLGLMRAYRLTLRFYQGAEDQLPTRSGLDTQKAPARTALLVQRRLPFLPDDTAALALATFRSLSRAPEIKMALIMPIVAGAALTSLPLRKLQNAPPETLTSFAVTVVALLSVFAFAPVMGNAFGLDRNGFRALVLLPTPRQRILLAKNLAFLPLVTGVGLVLLTLVAWIFRMTWGAVLAGLLQILITFFSFCLAGNLTSVLVPYRMALGTLQAKKPKPIVFLATAIAMLVMPIVLSPAVIPPALQLLWSFVWGVPWWFSVNLVASLIVLIAVGWLYWFVLPSQGRLLQRREQAILREVTEELE